MAAAETLLRFVAIWFDLRWSRSFATDSVQHGPWKLHVTYATQGGAKSHFESISIGEIPPPLIKHTKIKCFND